MDIEATNKTLHAVFRIPKKHIKNSNLMINHIVGAQKSAWIREYAETVWLDAVATQYPDLIIQEPRPEDLPNIELPSEFLYVQEGQTHLEEELAEIEEEAKNLQALKAEYTENKAKLRVLKKNKASFSETLDVEQKISDYERVLVANAASKKRVKAALSAYKKLHGKSVAKEIGRVERARRKQYIAQKIVANQKQLLFEKCAVIVRVHNITDHDFDAPNFYPTVKPILDAATDTGIIWSDDNNNIISGGTLFLFGEKQSRDDYVFEIEITNKWSWEN